ncbi:Zinc finger protein 1, partial [Clonorchis sinensis]
TRLRNQTAVRPKANACPYSIWEGENIANHTCTSLLVEDASARNNEKEGRTQDTYKSQNCVNKTISVQQCANASTVGTQRSNLHKCNVCNKAFPKKWRLERHARTHSDLKQYKCNHCGRTYTYKWGLPEHATLISQKKCSRKKIQERECPTCSKTFLRKDQLVQHSWEKPFCCESCQASFPIFGDLQQHLHAIHLKPKDTQLQEVVRPAQVNVSSFPCGIQQNKSEQTNERACSFPAGKERKSLPKRKGKTVGEALPTSGEKTSLSNLSSCTVCGRTFVKTWNLKRHAAVHKNRETYECQACKLQFKNICTLKDHHLLVHSRREDADRRKVHTCHICGKPFLRKDYLEDHLRTHSKEQTFGCNLCGSKFTFARNLKKHQRQAHSAETSSADRGVNPPDSHP